MMVQLLLIITPSAIKTYAVLSIGGKNSVHAGKTPRPFVTGSGYRTTRVPLQCKAMYALSDIRHPHPLSFEAGSHFRRALQVAMWW